MRAALVECSSSRRIEHNAPNTIYQDAASKGAVVGLDVETGKTLLPDKMGIWDNYVVKKQFLHLGYALCACACAYLTNFSRLTQHYAWRWRLDMSRTSSSPRRFFSCLNHSLQIFDCGQTFACR